MKRSLVLIAATLGGLLAACSGAGGGGNRINWTCTALAGEQYFQGYGATREQAFESAMQQCNMNAPDASSCMGAADKCIPPSKAQ
jgi:hypothetical protein